MVEFLEKFLPAHIHSENTCSSTRNSIISVYIEMGRRVGKSIFGPETGVPPVIKELNVLASLMKTMSTIQTVNDIEKIIGYFNKILFDIRTETNIGQYEDGTRYLVDGDPFGLQGYTDLNTLTFVLTSIINVLEVLKITMEQKGFKGTGINVSVPVVPTQLTLYI